MIQSKENVEQKRQKEGKEWNWWCSKTSRRVLPLNLEFFASYWIVKHCEKYAITE